MTIEEITIKDVKDAIEKNKYDEGICGIKGCITWGIREYLGIDRCERGRLLTKLRKFSKEGLLIELPARKKGGGSLWLMCGNTLQNN